MARLFSIANASCSASLVPSRPASIVMRTSMLRGEPLYYGVFSGVFIDVKSHFAHEASSTSRLRRSSLSYWELAAANSDSTISRLA